MSESESAPELPRQDVLRITLLSEGLLLLIGSAWLFVWPEHIGKLFDTNALVLGLLTALPLFAVNFFLGHFAERTRALVEFSKFRKRYVAPICSNLTAADALFIALLSGIAEELLFRGLLLHALLEILPFYLAHGLVAVLFAYVHLLWKVKEFPLVFVLYIVAAVILGALVEVSGSLTAPIACHACFNFLSLMTFRTIQKGHKLR